MYLQKTENDFAQNRCFLLYVIRLETYSRPLFTQNQIIQNNKKKKIPKATATSMLFIYYTLQKQARSYYLEDKTNDPYEMEIIVQFFFFFHFH